MGHRANFVVIENGSARAYYHQWGAMGCLEGLRAGPDSAIEMLADCEETAELLDWAFAEGGYLLDYDDKIAIVFGSPVDESAFDFKELDEEPADQGFEEFNPETYLRELAPNWQGWRLRFDDRGVDAFAAYLRSKSIDGITCQPASHPADTKRPCEIQA